MKVVSRPGTGRLGTMAARTAEAAARPAPARNTALGDTSQTRPKTAGITTAAMWLIVNPTAAVDAMSRGSAIFWN